MTVRHRIRCAIGRAILWVIEPAQDAREAERLSALRSQIPGIAAHARASIVGEDGLTDGARILLRAGARHGSITRPQGSSR